MAFDFPNSPTVGQQVTAANGVVYRWDGTKWTPVVGSNAVTSFNTRTGAVALTAADITATGAITTPGALITQASLTNAGLTLWSGLPTWTCSINAFKGATQNQRWQLLLGDATNEGGLNTGSNLTINSYADNGSILGTPLTITRASGAVAILGTATNDNAAAGQVGEFISSAVSGPGASMTTATAANVTSISLTAGDWEVQGEVWFGVGTGGATSLTAGIGTTSATFATQPSANLARAGFTLAFTASVTHTVALSPCRISLASTTTVYLLAQAGFPSGTTTCYGVISARRRR